MTKCKHDDGECGFDIQSTDSLQKVIDDLRIIAKDMASNNPHCPEFISGSLLSYADRLEALQKQPVAWMDENGLLGYAKWGQYKIPLIRSD